MLLSMSGAAFAAPGATTNDPFFNTLNQVGACGNAYNFGSCTANDFRITSVQLSNIVDSCIASDDYFQADVTVQFSKAQPIRYDVMAYFYRGEEAGDPFLLAPDAADTGLWCTRVGLQNDLTIFDGPLDSGLRTGDIDDEDNDLVTGNDPDAFCFDAPNGAADGTMSQTNLSMVLPCRDGDLNGTVDIATCTGWANNAGSICSGPEYDGITEPQNGTGSKCNCAQFDTDPAISLPEINVVKTCAGDGTGGTNAPDAFGMYAPGDTVLCEIVVANAGGTLDAATVANEEGFFFVDDYDESNGAISSIGFVNSSGSLAGTFANSAGALSVYPDDILTGGTVLISYLYTLDAAVSFDQVSEDVPNEVCPYYYDSTNMTATLNSDFCAEDTIVANPVSLSDFAAVQQGSDVAFYWSTATETNNLGFNLYGQYGQSRIKLNTQIIPSQAVNSLEVLDYELSLPKSVVGGAREFYLEDIDLTGKASMAGPFVLSKVNEAKRVRSTKTDWAAIGVKNRGQFTKLSKQATPKSNKGQDASKGKNKQPGSDPTEAAAAISLAVERSGVTRVTSAELSAFGFLDKDLRAGRFVLSDAAGAAVPSRYVPTSNKAGVLEFVAKVDRTFYAHSNRYTLTASATRDAAFSMRSASEFAPAAGANAAFYMETAKVGRDAVYHLGSTLETDPWMMQQIIAFGANASATTIAVPMDDLAVDAGVASQVSAQVLGGFDPPGRQDRMLRLRVNEQTLDAQPGFGLRENQLSGTVTLDANRTELPVTIATLQTNDFGIDLSYLNEVSVTYPRLFKARDESLSFASANAQLSVSGFTAERVSVYAEVGTDVVFLGEHSTSGGTVEFSGISGAQRYLVAGAGTVQSAELAAIQVIEPTAINASSLVIAHPQFLGAELDGYVQWRDATLGSRSNIVSTQDIYCRYTGCVRSAFAIQQFIREMHAQSPLDSVLLVGGDVYDYHNNLGVGAEAFVPTLYARTSELIGFAPVDALYGDTDEDGIPEVAIGRMPVRTQGELTALLNKSMLFGEQQGRTTAVLTEDEENETDAYNFSNGSDRVADILSAQGWSLNRQYLDDYLAQDTTGSNRNFFLEQARQGVFQAHDSGPRLSIYTGHSSAISWSFSKLFDYTAATRLSNIGSPSLYLQWGCYNTYYSHPTIESLSHGLLLSGEQGAALVIGASSLTNAKTEEQFAQLIQAELVAGAVSTGQAMVAAKRRLAEENGVVDPDILWSVTLLGDPELQL